MNRIHIVYAAIGLLLAGCTASAKQEDKAADTAPAVTETFVLKKDTLSSGLQLPGELIAFQQVDLYAKVSSFVKELKADLGTEVKEGQLLVVLEAPEISSQLVAAESRLRSQEAVYAASKATYDRLLETSKTPGTVSKNELDQAEARKNSDLAQLDAAKAMYKEVTTMKNYLEIRAPFSGIITARNVNPGAFVGPAGRGSEQPLFTLQEQKKLRLTVSVPEAFAGFLKPGDAVKFGVRSLPGEEFTARISRMAGALDLRLRSEKIEMDVYNTDKKLLPGMVAEVRLPIGQNDSAFIVPKTAVVSSAEGIFLVRSVDNKAQRVEVRKGREQNNKVEVFGNLEAGGIYVVKAGEELRDGTPLNGAAK